MGKDANGAGFRITKRVNKKGFFGHAFWLILVLVVLCGCGEKGVQPEGGESVAASDEWVPIHVLEHSWKGFEEAEEAQEPWHPEEYRDGFGQLSDGEGAGSGRGLDAGRDWNWDSSLYAWSGDLFYELSDYYADGEEAFYIYQLACVDTVSMKEAKTILDFPKALPKGEDGSNMAGEQEWREFLEDLKGGRVRAISMDATEDRLYLFFAQYHEDWTLKHYYLVETGMDLEVRKVIDFAEKLAGDGQEDLSSVPEGYLAKDGDICFVDAQKKQLTLFTAEGEAKGMMDLESIAGDVRIGLTGRAQDGTPVFQALDWNGGVTWFTPEAILYEGKLYLTHSSLDDAGGMLLWQNADLVRWNVETGEAKKLCGLNGLQAVYCKGIRKNSAGQIVLAYDEGDGLYFYRYAVGVQKEEKVLRIGAFYVTTYVQTCAADYERTHPGISIEFMEFENPFQNAMALNKLAEECKAGEGPDMILFTTKEQVDAMQQAGCLAPMESMLSQETKNGLFACALELGRTEGEIYGIPYGMYLQCYLLPGNLISGEEKSWTVREMMDRFEESRAKNTGMERFFGAYYPKSSQSLLYELCLLNLDDSPFVDFDKRSCSFDSKEFCDLLQFCRDHADGQGIKEYYKDEEVVAQMRSGQAFLYPFSGGLASYSKVRAELGKDFIPIGIASESGAMSKSEATPKNSTSNNDAVAGAGFLTVSNDFLTVNAFSESLELTADFLEYLLSERCQAKYGEGNWVRKDVIEGHVRERVHIEEILEGGSIRERTECHFVMGKGAVMPLAVDENGDSFVKEYLAIMDGAKIYSAHPELREIISEEADAYFTGAKTAQEVSRLIQNRVELFLKE